MPPQDNSYGMNLILAERQEQIDKHGHTFKDDDKHVDNRLGVGGRCYEYADGMYAVENWPFDYVRFNISDNPMVNYKKAGAMYLAESERFARKFLHTRDLTDSIASLHWRQEAERVAGVITALHNVLSKHPTNL